MALSTPAAVVDRPTVLVVDDDLPFFRIVSELLTDRGFTVLGHAMTAHDAVVECRRLDPDAVLLDVRLPDGHGVALVQTLRELPGAPRVLLTSGDPTAVSTEQLRLSGARGFVPKSELARSDLAQFFSD